MSLCPPQQLITTLCSVLAFKFQEIKNSTKKNKHKWPEADKDRIWYDARWTDKFGEASVWALTVDESHMSLNDFDKTD